MRPAGRGAVAGICLAAAIAIAAPASAPAAGGAVGTAAPTGRSAGPAAAAATSAWPGAGRAFAAQLAGSSATDCEMRRHSKRVVHRVRRHGRLRTVRKTRHWWSCDAPATPPASQAPPPEPAPTPTAPPTPVVDPGPAPEPELEPSPNRLGVKAAEYSYTLSRQSVSAGEVTIELDNRGQDGHNLNLRPVDSEAAPLTIEETGSLERRRADFRLEPGTYRLWCSLPTHDEAGMHATLVVEAPSP